MGSVAEDTRIGFGNELDLTMDMDAWRGSRPPFRVRDGDPFHLWATDNLPDWMAPYCDASGRFELKLFIQELLTEIEAAVEKIFESGRNPVRLRRVTTNAEYGSPDWKCLECR